MKPWHEIKHIEQVLSPALLVHPKTIQQNIKQMVSIAGSPDRLRPHVKTYKMPQIVNMQREAGIHQFKCSTSTECRMLLDNGVRDIIWALPLVGPAQKAFLDLCRSYPDTKLATLVDHPDQLDMWEQHRSNEPINLYIDLNVGMNRTGIAPKNARDLLEQITTNPAFVLRGFHIYDGHIRTEAYKQRKKDVASAYALASSFFDQVEDIGTYEIVCGGSVSFSIHAKDPRRTLSPGTTLLWDAGYGNRFSDLPFKKAACLLARVISKPAKSKLCLDLGHKSVGSEMTPPRVLFPDIPRYVPSTHSEEHMVIEVPNPGSFQIGDTVVGFPYHICPTVALHEKVQVVENHEIIDEWSVVARERTYRI